ncbi:hypothetical protein SS1G_06276 [Sclerotinia sclerotiorum 1980 UF-70]|uniref:Reverse transcriptase domain-containing protein n=1 Tax=Sclerotinia sclerotiorum (strain ATCC 18683 / 1980 / Ss-1) TaxID=665079 RepID=A7ELS9_SCLS1|nr:hypothetical protein SS1G_06276 [Sclerotinia sclerotiorum 1980 UF-70]EDO03795.1 hypothetical protein SS1G_06276 [Sclerotinia sclerotiorum 1980 UF-70]
MDVKGAFDTVLPGRLVNRLREQGWPNNLVRWVQSFATNRSIKIRLDGHRILTDTSTIHTGSINIKVKPGPLKWLGVHFDRKLYFKPHIQILATKALKGANALRSLIITCTKAILPIYKTTNTAVLYEEAKLRPSEIELNLISQLYAVRTTRLDLYHPLRIRAENIIKAREYNYTPDTRFARFITALPETEHINPLAFPPWEIRESRAEAEACINGLMGRTKAQAAEDFKAFHAKILRSDIQIFSDGSKSESKDGAIGGGFVILQFDIQIVYHSFSLGTNVEVFNVEATAAVAGVAKALTLASTKLATDL